MDEDARERIGAESQDRGDCNMSPVRRPSSDSPRSIISGSSVFMPTNASHSNVSSFSLLQTTDPLRQNSRNRTDLSHSPESENSPQTPSPINGAVSNAFIRRSQTDPSIIPCTTLSRQLSSLDTSNGRVFTSPLRHSFMSPTASATAEGSSSFQAESRPSTPASRRRSLSFLDALSPVRSVDGLGDRNSIEFHMSIRRKAGGLENSRRGGHSPDFSRQGGSSLDIARCGGGSLDIARRGSSSLDIPRRSGFSLYIARRGGGSLDLMRPKHHVNPLQNDLCRRGSNSAMTPEPWHSQAPSDNLTSALRSHVMARLSAAEGELPGPYML